MLSHEHPSLVGLHVPLMVLQPLLVMVHIGIGWFIVPQVVGPEDVCNGEMKQRQPENGERVVQTEKQDQCRRLRNQNTDRGRSSKV